MDLSTIPAPAKALLDHGFDYGSAYALVVAGAMTQNLWLLGGGVVVGLLKLASDLTDKKPTTPAA
jgi:hypothetical protein